MPTKLSATDTAILQLLQRDASLSTAAIAVTEIKDTTELPLATQL